MSSQEKHKVIIADDHNLIRSGLKKLLEENDELTVVAEASDGTDLIKYAKKLDFDLLITDLAMPKVSGIQAIEEIRKVKPDCKIIVLSMYKEPEYLQKVLNLKVQGYLLKEDIHEQLTITIRSVLAGQVSFSPSLTAHLATQHAKQKKDRLMFEILTRREQEVFSCLARGMSNQEVASFLGIGKRTVETHRQNLMNKMDFANIQQLVRYAIENDLVDDDESEEI